MSRNNRRKITMDFSLVWHQWWWHVNTRSRDSFDDFICQYTSMECWLECSRNHCIILWSTWSISSTESWRTWNRTTCRWNISSWFLFFFLLIFMFIRTFLENRCDTNWTNYIRRFYWLLQTSNLL